MATEENDVASILSDRKKLRPRLRGVTKIGSTGTRILSEAFHFACIDAKSLPDAKLSLRMGFMPSHKFLDRGTRRRQQQAIRRLEDKKLIKTVASPDGLHIMLTDAGVAESLCLEVMNAPILDYGTECVVIFDIPETHKALRNALRYFLLRAGFFMFQRSVYISPFDAFATLARFLTFKGATDWVKVYRGIPVDLSKGASIIHDRKKLKPFYRSC